MQYIFYMLSLKISRIIMIFICFIIEACVFVKSFLTSIDDDVYTLKFCPSLFFQGFLTVSFGFCSFENNFSWSVSAEDWRATWRPHHQHAATASTTFYSTKSRQGCCLAGLTSHGGPDWQIIDKYLTPAGVYYQRAAIKNWLFSK